MLLNVYKLARTTNKFVYLNMLESKVNHKPKQTPLQSCIPGETEKKAIPIQETVIFLYKFVC